MHYRKISAPVIFIFISIISIFFFQSCSDNEMTSPSGTFIGGIVTDTSGKLLHGVKVKIGDKTTRTDDHGFYRFADINMPYDIVLIDEPTKSQLLIKSVNVPYIKIPDFFSYNNTDASAELSISLPPDLLQTGMKGKLIFTDGVDKTFSKEITEQNTSLQIRIRDNKFIYGNMIVLIYSADSEGNILSYENYFKSQDLLIIPDQDIHFYLDLQQLSFNPEERAVSGMIDIPPGYVSGDRYFYLNFASSTPLHSPALKFSSIGGNNFNIIVPVDLPSQFSILIHNSMVSSDNRKSGMETFKFPENSNNAVFSAKLPPELTSPAQNSTGVSLNPLISFTDGDGVGLYITRFTKGDYYCSVITTSKSFQFSEISKFEIGFINDSEFGWSVEKHGEITDLNQYLCTYPDSSGRFVSKSEQRTFHTVH